VAFPTSQTRISAAESSLGVRLLDAHRARLAANNGGTVACEGQEWQLHPVFDDTDRRTTSRTASDLVHETREARSWSGFPEDAIAIASDGSGNSLVFRPARGMIERWDHETSECIAVDVDWSPT